MFVFTCAGVLFYCLCPTRRHLKCAEIAIAHGADVNNVCTQGLPVFIAACEGAKNAEELCLAMLNAGADPKIVDSVRQTHIQTDRQTNGQTDRRMDGWIDGWTNWRTDTKRIYIHTNT